MLLFYVYVELCWDFYIASLMLMATDLCEAEAQELRSEMYQLRWEEERRLEALAAKEQAVENWEAGRLKEGQVEIWNMWEMDGSHWRQWCGQPTSFQSL